MRSGKNVVTPVLEAKIISPSGARQLPSGPYGVFQITGQAIRFGVIAEGFSLWIKSADAVVSAQPEISMTVFENRLDGIIG